MEIYLFTLVCAVFLAYIAEYGTNRNSQKKLNGELNTYVVIALIIFLSIISGFRYMNYYLSDEYNYRVGVDAIKGIPLSQAMQRGYEGEWLFNIISWICANVFPNSQGLILVTSVLTHTSIVLFFKKYARPFWFAIFLYICGGAFFTSMNVLRSYLALAVIIWCYKYVREKKLLKYVILVAIAGSIHLSAWYMLPFYFVLKSKNIRLRFMLIILLALVVFVNFESVMTMLLSNSAYDRYLDDILSGGYGVKLIRIMVWLIPYGVIIAFRNRMHNILGVPTDIIYAVGIAASIMIISYQYVYVARMDIYFTIVAITAVIKIPDLFGATSKKLISFVMLLLFFIFGAYQMSISPEYHNILVESISGVL